MSQQTEAVEKVPHAVDPRRVAEHSSVVMRLVDEVFPLVEGLYVDLHKNPELSHQEHRTARAVAEWLGRAGFEIETGVGGTGVVGVLRNGDGPTVLLRGDMDALPLQEQTGMPYASTARGVDDGGNDVPVMHACGHDAHTACLVGTADLLANARERWSGTLMVVAQPAEETIDGASAVLGDGLYSRYGRPDIALAQHLGPQPAGMVSHRAGVILGATSTLKVRIFGSGGNASQPHLTVDPVVIASSIVARVQTVVGREISPSEMAVVTVGVLRAGTRANVIPDEAYLEINTRALNETVARRLHSAIERIVRAEASAAGAPREPEIEVVEEAGVTSNDPEATRQLAQAHRAYFGDAYVIDLPEPFTGSEDFGAFGLPGDPNPVPYVYWFIGATPHDVWEAAPGQTPYEKLEVVPGSHSPHFAPDREPTLTAGLAAMTVAALTYLGRPDSEAPAGQRPAFLQDTPQGTPVVDAPPPEELAEPVPGPPPPEYAESVAGPPPEEGAPSRDESNVLETPPGGRFSAPDPDVDPGPGGAGPRGGAFSEPAPDFDSPARPAYGMFGDSSDVLGEAAPETGQDTGNGGAEYTHAADMADLLYDDSVSTAQHGGDPQPGSEYPSGPAFPAPPPQGPPVAAAPPPPDAEPYPGEQPYSPEQPWSADRSSYESYGYETPEQPQHPPEDPPYQL